MLSANLPDDVVMEIAVRLPVKSLLRFKSVAKSWHALITDPTFITQHLEWSGLITKKRGLRLAFMTHRPDRLVRISLISKDEPSVPDDMELPFPVKDNLTEILVYGHCNGIFCLHGLYKGGNPRSFYHANGDESHLLLWNPATKEVKVLPVPNLHPPEDKVLLEFAFGIDRITKDYKVVQFLTLPPSAGKHPPVDVEVYNLSTDSWRTIDAAVPAFLPYYAHLGTHLNGVCHWITFDKHPIKRAILCFDFSKEVFRKIRLPFDHCYTVQVTVIDGSLACVATYKLGGTRSIFEFKFEIWVMNEYGVESSWTKRYEIAQPEIICILGFWGDYEILGEVQNGDIKEGQLVSYDRRNQQVQRFEIFGVSGYIDVSEYTESLVPLT